MAQKAGKAGPALAVAGALAAAPQAHKAAPARPATAKQMIRLDAARTSAGRTYTVRPGDSLSAIAGRVYHNPAAWPVLYWRNRGQVRWADMIETGQVLRIPAEPARIPGPPAVLQPPPQPPVPAVADYTPRHASPAPAPAPAPAQAALARAATPTVSSYPGGVPGGAFGQCVVSRESGGQAQIMNSSGHYGLYQFGPSTWAEYGGDPADFGNASVAEQNQVFANALASGGEFNWAPYDGC